MGAPEFLNEIMNNMKKQESCGLCKKWNKARNATRHNQHYHPWLPKAKVGRSQVQEERREVHVLHLLHHLLTDSDVNVVVAFLRALRAVLAGPARRSG